MTQLLCSGVASVNPHQPVKITRKLQNGLTREVLNSTTAIHPPNTWQPDLYFDLKTMVNVPWARGYLREQGSGHAQTHPGMTGRPVEGHKTLIVKLGIVLLLMMDLGAGK